MKRTRSEVARVAHAPAGTAALGPSEWPTELQAEVLERYARGQSGEVISELLELPASSVYRLLREQGVLRPRGAVKRIGERGRPQVEEAPGVTEILRRRAAGERDPANVGPTEVEAEVVEQ